MTSLEGIDLHILLAEDMPATEFLISRMFRMRGHTVVSVNNGKAAVAAANERRWDIILMDMQMPVMDGPEAVRLIRLGNGPSVGTPIVALTADATQENHWAYLDAGCNIVATKPVEWTALSRQIAGLVGQGGQLFAPASEAGAPLIDRAFFQELRMSIGDEACMVLITKTLDSLKQYVSDLRDALAAKDDVQVRRTAHKIKGLSSQLGVQRATEIACAIEDRPAAAELIASLEKVVEDAREAF